MRAIVVHGGAARAMPDEGRGVLLVGERACEIVAPDGRVGFAFTTRATPVAWRTDGAMVAGPTPSAS